MRLNWAYFVCAALLAVGITSCSESEEPVDESNDLTLDELIEKYPDSVSFLVKRGTEALNSYQYELAMSDAAKAFRLDSNNLQVKELYADVLNTRPDRTVEQVYIAQRHYKELLQQIPESPSVLVGLAATFKQQQDFEESFKYINEALRIDPRYRDAYVLKGSIYKILGQPDLMKSSYETAVQQDPEFFEGYTALGIIYQSENNPLCIEYFTTAYQLQPENLEAKYSMAYAKQHYGQLEEAKSVYREMATDTIDFYVSQALFQLAHIKQFVDGDIDSAMYFYHSAIMTEPRFVEAHHNMGICYDLKGNKTEALKSFGQALKHNPEFELSRQYADSIRFL